MKQQDKVNKVVGKVIGTLIEFCINEKILNPKITMEAKTTDGEKYRLLFKRIDLDNKDELYEKAKELAISKGVCSCSMLQREFLIGYNRSGRIMDELEDNGIVEAFNGSRERRVLVLAASCLPK